MILFLGHTLNIVMSLMAVFFFWVRLYILLFFGNPGMQWGGGG
ncbi:hypothetical protein OMAG_001925 [Candidatus Omnitrophus magneticus]|uniref:Uncharacterized protein n=1 Tax=Candidatus Omnitrophus magneticus TaxID=1609969 RepID=A0A0F0CLM1_9BACT|nr:hypothetical protein OMAG_001925 [Candidatus Omnitrophus magneticus]